MLLYKHTQFPLYKHYLTIVATDSWKEFNDKFGDSQDERITPYGTTIDGVRIVKGLKYRCIYMVFNPTYTSSIVPKFTYGVIAHEAEHAKNLLFERIGIDLSITNDEPSAYLTEWIFDTAFDFVQQAELNF